MGTRVLKFWEQLRGKPCRQLTKIVFGQRLIKRPASVAMAIAGSGKVASYGMGMDGFQLDKAKRKPIGTLMLWQRVQSQTG
ncbi:MAG: hypothetical protein Unbinned338contig1000_38 [Prokaryotic dsDNA virus sp.]|nr:MAG: hypothetical protein Unbinned338contig1000_38 [Prokaryotic dsDNA virus sp.]